MKKIANLDSITVQINAKINLALAVGGVALNGKHNLDTVMAEVSNLSDTIQVTKRADSIINVVYTTGQQYSNDIALKMAKAIQQAYNTSGVDIAITKRIPEGCGVGGSSADASGVVRAMQQLFGINVSQDILLKVGSDVPYMVHGGVMRVSGSGEVLQSVQLKPIYGVLAYKQGLHISTKEAFTLFDTIGGDQCDIASVIAGGKPTNALERAGIVIEPSILELKEMLLKSGLQYVVMTGSGSGYIAYTYNKKEFTQAVENIKTNKDGNIKTVIFAV